MARIISGDPDEQIPPPSTHKDPLTRDQIDLLRWWIYQGVPWQRHWSFRPIKRAETPSVRHDDWTENSIDVFVLQRLEMEYIEPSLRARRETLIRRITFDLIGLPPQPDDVQAFVSNDRVDAYDRLVDRLLASPQYGERWARFGPMRG